MSKRKREYQHHLFHDMQNNAREAAQLAVQWRDKFKALEEATLAMVATRRSAVLSWIELLDAAEISRLRAEMKRDVAELEQMLASVSEGKESKS